MLNWEGLNGIKQLRLMPLLPIMALISCGAVDGEFTPEDLDRFDPDPITIPTVPTNLDALPSTYANDNSPQIAGKTSAAASVEIFSDSSCTTSVASGSANSSGNFSITIAATDDTVTTYYANATNSAGTSACSTASVTYTEDSTDPADPTITSTTPSSPSSDLTITVNGTGDADETYNIYTDSGCTTLAGSESDDGAGNYNVDVTATAFATTTYYVQAEDEAGNTSNCIASVAFEGYEIASGMGIFRGSRTTSGTNINLATAELGFDYSRFDFNYYSHSVTTNNHQIEIEQDGNYLINVIVPQTSSTAYSSVNVQVAIDGTDFVGANSFDSLVSTINNHDNASNHMTVLLSDLKAGEVITVTTQKNGATATVTIPTQATVTLEYISSSRQIFSAIGQKVTSGTNLNTADEFEWTEDQKSSGFTHSDSTDPEDITVTSAGTYFVAFNAVGGGSTSAINIKYEISVNGTPAPGAVAKQGIISALSGHLIASAHWSGVLYNLSANDVITVATSMEAQAGTARNPGGSAASIFIEKIDTSTNMFFAQGTTLVGGNDWNPATAEEVQWTSRDFIDTDYFTHDTSTNSHQVTLKKQGDYMVYYSASLTGAISSSNSSTTIQLDGTDVTGAENHSPYISNLLSHTESSGYIGVMLYNVQDNEVLTIKTVQEAENGTVNDDDDALLFIWKK